MTTPVDIASAAWGADLPDWVARLAEECRAASQNKVAARMNRSASLVSAVLRNKYAGDLTAVEEIVRGLFFSKTVECPALGEISSATCRDWMQAATRFSNINSERVRMYRACRGCPRMKKEGSA